MKKLAFVALSDTHVNRVWGAHTVPLARPLLTARYLDPIKEAISRYVGTPLLHGGDWFDKAHNSEAVVHESSKLLAKMHAVIAGNHDHSGRHAAVTSLQLLEGLEGQGSGVAIIAPDHLNDTGPTVQTVNGVLVGMVPHHGTQALFEQACAEVANYADDAAWKGTPKVLMVHCNVGAVGGGKPDSCLYLTPQLQASLEKSFDFILVGHEHLPRQIGKVVVMGSTQPCNFGELGPRFFYEFYLEDGKLTLEKVPVQTQLRHETLVANPDGTFPPFQSRRAELIDLQGKVPVAHAKSLQKLVKDLYAAGALAVRMGVEFDKGTGQLGADQVNGTMQNLVDVVRGEISDNKAWADLFEASLESVGAVKP